MAQGRVAGELSGDELSEESVMRLAVHTQDRRHGGNDPVTFAQTIVRRNRLAPSYIIVTILLDRAGHHRRDRLGPLSELAEHLKSLPADVGSGSRQSRDRRSSFCSEESTSAVGSMVSATTVFLANFLDWRPDLVWVAVPVALAAAAGSAR